MNSRYVLLIGLGLNLGLFLFRLLSMQLKRIRRNRALFVDYERVCTVGGGIFVCDFNVFV
jgi:hypothetical protein